MSKLSINRISTGLIAASLSLLLPSAAVMAADNGQTNSKHIEFEQELNQFFSGRMADERYIVTFKHTENSALSDSEGGVSFSDDVSFDALQAKSLLDRAGATTHKILAPQRMVAATLDAKALEVLLNDPSIESIAPDVKRQQMAQSTPFGYTMVQANGLAQSDTSARKVCVIDTGYSLGHPDLPDENAGVTGDANNALVGNWFEDGDGHGTHVAGTIAALDNGIGSIGVYPGVDLHIVKIFDNNGDWTYASDLIDGINQCQNAGANVVNMSLGGVYASSAERAAIDQFNADGILLVAAAGNDGSSSKAYPASYDAVVSVGAVDWRGDRAYYSQTNDQVELAAPGSAVLSTYNNDNYVKLTGTSMATPHVAGVAALVWSFHPQCTNTEIRSALTATALDKGAEGKDNLYGHGIVQASAAAAYLDENVCEAYENEVVIQPVSETIYRVSAYKGNWRHFNFNVPDGATKLKVAITGGWGEADLYVNHGSRPELEKFDCRPRMSRNSEVCEFNAPESGYWHVGIYARNKNYSNVTLEYSYEFSVVPPSTEPVLVELGKISAYNGNWKRFNVDIPTGTNKLTVEIQGGWGEADLYVNHGVQPEAETFECRPRIKGNNEVCVFNSPESGTWHFGVFALNKNYSNTSIRYRYE